MAEPKNGQSQQRSPKDYSPFTPGVPVPAEFFVGRQTEIEYLKDRAGQASTGRLQVAFLSGERGIGKTSLASFARLLAEREFQVLGLHTFLGGVSSLAEMVRLVFDRLLKESIGNETRFERVKKYLGDHIRQVGLFGVSVEFSPADADLRRMVQDFAPALRNLLQQLEGDRRAILLILDDINGLANSAEFANWLKSLVDEIATAREPLALCLLLVGVEERRQALISLQPSLARVFDLTEIRAWAPAESADFFRQAFSKVGVHVEENAIQALCEFSGGLPVLAHEIGDAVFKADTDGRVELADAIAGIIAAAEIVGRKYLQPQVFQALRSDRYRNILRRLASTPAERGVDPRFTRKSLLKDASQDEAKVVDNFLSRMKELGVIHADADGGPGAYTFSNRLHLVYFQMEALIAKHRAR
jgi:hypothetical protein